MATSKPPITPPPAPRRTRAKPAKTRKADVAYDPAGKPVCPHCFSAPSVRLRAERMLAGRRGASVSVSNEVVVVEDRSVPVMVTVYPCSNPECRTDLVLRAALGSSATTNDLLAPFRAQHQLSAQQLQDYATGRRDAGGIWRQASLFSESKAAKGGKSARR